MKVIKAGLYTSVQDMGRSAYAGWGVPMSGCMDRNAAQLANRLVGNPVEAAVLECTMMGPELEFEHSGYIAIAGAEFELYLNGELISTHTAYKVMAGDHLVFGKLVKGLRGYLAIAGGFQSAKVLESRSYYIPITSQGRVKEKDMIPYEERQRIRPSEALKSMERTPLETQIIEAGKGPEYDWLSDAQKTALESIWFAVSNRNNRMAYQLEPNLGAFKKNRITCPVVPGTVQMTPEGSLFVLMRDGQTTGGYPRVLQIAENSLNALSQLRTGSSFQLKIIE